MKSSAFDPNLTELFVLKLVSSQSSWDLGHSCKLFSAVIEMFSPWGRTSNKFLFSFSLFLLVAELLTDWVINTSNAGMATVDAAWPHYSYGQNEELLLYAVVCTPTLGEAGPTILTIEPGVNSSKVERLRPYTEYTAQVIALGKSDPGEEMSFKGSMVAYFKTDEGGKRRNFQCTGGIVILYGKVSASSMP